MKRNTLIAAVICLIMLATTGAGAAFAKQDENPRQAGESSIYFYDVEATDTHGFGHLMINVDKHTFVFIGKDFVPSAQLELRARAEGSSDHVMFAKGKATPSGNLQIAGTWEADDPPAGVSLDYEPISEFVLFQNGLFIAKVACFYSTDFGVTWVESDHSEALVFYPYHGFHIHLEDLGVPVGALVKIHVIVEGGAHKTGSEVFQHQYVNHWATYCISGYTWKHYLDYWGYDW